MMVKQKKLKSISEKYASVKSKIKRMKYQLGKYKKTQKQRIESKKRKMTHRVA